MSFEEFYRIKRLPPYVFAQVNEMKAKARAQGEDIIDFGMGNPDRPTPEHIVQKLCETVQDYKTHRYSMSKGILGIRKALSAYYKRRFNVDLDPQTEVVATIGSKEGLANLANAITAPGDVVLAPNPSYPIHMFGFIIAGGSLRNIPVEPDENLIKAIDRAARHSVPKPIAVVLNYPSNPTAKTASLDFYKEVVRVCKKHEIYILSDIAYAEIYFGDNKPHSIFEVEGAKDIAVEFYSLSKTYNMAGWRVGFASGNKRLISALTRVKSYLDYGAFTPVQVAATAALNGDQSCVEEIRGIYKKRRDVLIDGLGKAGWSVPKPDATMFAWAPLPKEFEHLGSLEFSKLLLKEANVAVAPGIGFGEKGEGYVRIAIVENIHRTRQAIKNIKSFMSNKDDFLKDYQK